MTKPFPCFCDCAVCSDYGSPWVFRCCDWFAHPASLKSHLDGLELNFGAITPASGGSQTWTNHGLTIGSSVLHYGSSSLNVGFDQTYYALPARIVKTTFPGGGQTNYDGDIDVRLYDVIVKFHVAYYSLALSCKRTMRVSVTTKAQLLAHDFPTAPAGDKPPGSLISWVNNSDSMTGSSASAFAPASTNCNDYAASFRPLAWRIGSTLRGSSALSAWEWDDGGSNSYRMTGLDTGTTDIKIDMSLDGTGGTTIAWPNGFIGAWDYPVHIIPQPPDEATISARRDTIFAAPCL